MSVRTTRVCGKDLKDLQPKDGVLTEEQLEELVKLVREEQENFKKTGIPRCIHCKKNMEMRIDSITGKLTKYEWKHTCDCVPDNFRLCFV